MGLHALTLLDENEKSELLKIAQADIQTAVDHMVSTKAEYGLSKWASLQAAEKILKHCIQCDGKKFSKTHSLSKLAKQFKTDIGVDEYIDDIQCQPGIRYGEEPSSLQDAIRAHHAVFKLTTYLIDFPEDSMWQKREEENS